LPESERVVGDGEEEDADDVASGHLGRAVGFAVPADGKVAVEGGAHGEVDAARLRHVA